MSHLATRSEPIIIQGGMGVAVSAWQLARAVSLTGQLGVVSGTAIDAVLVRRLQLGDPGGHMRRALAEFPYPGMAQRIADRYFIPGGKPLDRPFTATQVLPAKPTQEQLELVSWSSDSLQPNRVVASANRSTPMGQKSLHFGNDSLEGRSGRSRAH